MGISLPATFTLGTVARVAARTSALSAIGNTRASAADARALQARASLLPSVSAIAGDGQRSFNTASFGLSFPGFDPNGEVIGPVRTVDVRGRVGANLFAPATLGRYRTAQAAADAADAEAKAAAELAAANAANAYVRLLRADAQVRARGADSTLASELLGIARSQLQAGTGIGLDVTRAQAQLAGVRALLVGARAERERARVALLRSMALPLTANIPLGDSLAGLANGPDLPEAQVGPGREIAVVSDDTMSARTNPELVRGYLAAMNTRPDLIAARKQAETAMASLRAVRAERLPTLSVFGDEGFTSKSYAHLLNTYTVGLQLSVPIWEGGRSEARIGEQEAAMHEAYVRAADLSMQVGAEIATALVDLNSAKEQLLASAERLQLAEQEVAQARERFRAGVAGNADVIAAQLALDNARSRHIDVQSAVVSARVALARAEGRVTQLP